MKIIRKKTYRCFIMIFVFAGIFLSGSFVLADENECHYCGMKKAMFGHSWMTIEREDGSVVEIRRAETVGDYFATLNFEQLERFEA